MSLSNELKDAELSVWMRDGDKNTKLFHRRASIHKAKIGLSNFEMIRVCGRRIKVVSKRLLPTISQGFIGLSNLMARVLSLMHLNLASPMI